MTLRLTESIPKSPIFLLVFCLEKNSKALCYHDNGTLPKTACFTETLDQDW